MLADLDNLERRLTALQKKIKVGDKDAQKQLTLLEKIKPILEAGNPARYVQLDEEEKIVFKQLQLLTGKPVLYVANVREDEAASGNGFTAQEEEMALKEIGRASVGKECVSTCRSRWSP